MYVHTYLCMCVLYVSGSFVSAKSSFVLVWIRLPSMNFYYVEIDRVFYHRDVDYFVLFYWLRCEYFLLRCL